MGLPAIGGLRRNAGAPLAFGGLAFALAVQLLAPALAVAVGLACFLAGFPHGAADEQGDRFDAISPARLAAYLVIAAAFAALFLIQPLAGLASFFVLSAWHFARGDEAERSGFSFGKIATALTAIGGSMLFQPVATSLVLEAVTGTRLPELLAMALGLIGIAGAALTLVSLLKADAKANHALVALGAVALLHPVLAVGLVFLLTHALPIQLQQVARHGHRRVWNAVALPSLIAAFGAAALGIAVLEGWLALPVAAAIGFALATPHMLTERLEG